MNAIKFLALCLVTGCAVEIDPYARRVLLARQADGCLGRFPIWVTIQKRTPSTVQAVVRGELKVFRIGKYDGVEFIKPWGNYSMCPILRASDAQ